MSAGKPDPEAVTARMGEAADWLVRLQEDDVAESEVAAWLKWCAADAASLEAFERVQRLYDQLQALPVAEQLSFEKRRATARIPIGHLAIVGRPLAWARTHTRRLAAGLAAALVAALLVVAHGRHEASLPEANDYRTSRGVPRTLFLADRSHITLASTSEVFAHFTPTTRYVDLRQGEAYFEVQHDRSRPFVVRAGAMTVIAVGTKFNVRTGVTRTVVAVTEGAVDVTTGQPTLNAPAGGAVAEVIASPVRVRAGQEAVRESGRPGLTVVDVDTAAAINWQHGRLEYVVEPLSSVVEDVNRYTTHRIIIRDGSIGAMLFTGTIFIDRVDDWAMTLPAAFPLSTSIAADGTLTLQSRDRH